jgi:phytoene dehydrogenase-like protein
VAEGGSDAIVAALVRALESQGGEVVAGHRVTRLAELPPARVVLLDVSPRELVFLAGEALSPSYRQELRRFRYGPGVCKVDWALSGPVPWSAEECRPAGTVHVGGDFSEVATSEWEVSRGHHPEKPFVLCAQPGVVDPTRAPVGGHTLWTYCHVPSGSDRDMSEAVASQLERFAPGFRDLVLARSVMTAVDVEAHDANYVGGDIAGGVQDLWQTVFRPVRQWAPYRTPLKGVYLCSSSTPPGPGVHGRCGELAALRALRECFGAKHRPAAPAGTSRASSRTA